MMTEKTTFKINEAFKKLLLVCVLTCFTMHTKAQQFTQFDVASGVSQPRQVGFGDADGDGHRDIVVPEFAGNSMTVLYGTGHVSNFTKVTFGALFDPVGGGSMKPWAALLLDVNGDTELDIVFSNYANANAADGVYWMENLGNRSYGNVQVLRYLNRCRYISKVNFDADAASELLMLGDTNDANNLQVIDVSGGSPVVLLQKTVNRRPLHALFVDYTNDGEEDFIISKFGTGNETGGSTASTNGTHTLNSPAYDFGLVLISNMPTTSAGTRKSVAGDFDEDGDMDVISVNASGNHSSLKYFRTGGGQGTFLYKSDGSKNMVSITSGDYDNDNVLDFVVVDNATDQILLYENLAVEGVAAPIFTFNNPIALSSSIIDPNWIESVDIDNDGDLDLVVSSNNGGSAGSGGISVLENNTITLGLEEVTAATFDIQIYPNPTRSILNIASNQPIVQVKIFDLLGKELFTKTHTNTLDVSSLNQGLYLIEIKGDSGQTIHKRFLKK